MFGKEEPEEFLLRFALWVNAYLAGKLSGIPYGNIGEKGGEKDFSVIVREGRQREVRF